MGLKHRIIALEPLTIACQLVLIEKVAFFFVYSPEGRIERMYITQIDMYGSRAYPLVLGMIYGNIAEHYELPEIELLLQSLKREVSWPDRSRNHLEVHYLENMLEQKECTDFQVSFTTSKDARALTSLFLSIEQSQVKELSIWFPGRTGRMSATKVIAWMKSSMTTLHMPSKELEFEVQGFTEEGPSTYIKEHSLSAFVWIDALNRYLHVRENPRGIDDIKRGYAKL
jgi:hypothetical protein